MRGKEREQKEGARETGRGGGTWRERGREMRRERGDKERGEEERGEGAREGGEESILMSTNNNTVIQHDVTGFTFHMYSLSCNEMNLLLFQTHVKD